MFPELHQRMMALDLSVGEVLHLARIVSANDNLRTIDRLTAEERSRLIQEIDALFITA